MDSKAPIDRIALLNSANQFVPVSCSLGELFTDLAIYEPSKQSTSSVILSGKINNLEGFDKHPVLLKISPVYKDLDYDNSALIEHKIYTTVINKLITDHVTPHVSPYITVLACNAFSKANPPGEILTAWEKIQEDYYIPNLALILVLDENEKLNLKELLDKDTKNKNKKNPTPTNEQNQSLMFQVFYTLHCFNSLSPPLRHNDLHFGNILIETTPKDQVNTYILSKTDAYRVPTHGLSTKIFDFDRSFHKVNNTALAENGTFCKYYGTCNKINKVFDTFTAAYLFNERIYPKNKEDSQLANAALTDKATKANVNYFEENPFQYSHLMCNFDAKGCNGEATSDQQEYINTPDVIISKLFEEYKIEIASIDLNSPYTYFSSKELRKEMLKAAPSL